QSVGSLAHGTRQWIDIGMVMSQRPKLLLLDEPTAGGGDEGIARGATASKKRKRDAGGGGNQHDRQFNNKLKSLAPAGHQRRIIAEDVMENVQSDPRVREVYLGGSWHA